MLDTLSSTQLPSNNDHPLSAKGRFSRLSYIGWHGLVGLLYLFLCSMIMLLAGSFSFNINQVETSLFSAFSGTMFSVIFVLGFVVAYFQIIFLIRRLHDLNQTGWLCLLLLVPIAQIVLALYALLAPGTPAQNRYGAVRPTRAWEKLLAWLMILLGIFTLLGMWVFLYYFASPALWEAPTQMIQSNTKYF